MSVPDAPLPPSTLPPVVNLREKFDLIREQWQPKVVGELNGQQVRLAKLGGEFVWHSHEHEDELFMVVQGTLRLCFRDGLRDIGPGELVIVPRGVEHLPQSLTPEVWVLLFEPAGTVNTGTAADTDEGRTRTVRELERV